MTNSARRKFLAAAAKSSVVLATGSSNVFESTAPQHDHTAHEHPKPERPLVPRLPALICRMTGTVGIDIAYQMLKEGRDTLIAALHLTRVQEDDPNDSTTGLGGLPTADGEVELDACCLHGPTRRGAAVAAISGIRNASLLAQTVMEQTAYPLLVGQQAQHFALAHGFVKEDLTTDRTRKIWAFWKQIQAGSRPLGNITYDPNWPGHAERSHFLSASQKDLDLLVQQFDPEARQAGLDPQHSWRAAYDALFPAATPLYVSAVNTKNEISCAATTSGLPWRSPGAASDIAMIGCGCYLDPQVGSAGASGTAEANIKIAGAHAIVEAMSRGLSPEEAGLTALRRIVNWYRNDMSALRFIDLIYYVLRIDGAYAGVSLWEGDRTGHVQHFTIHDGLRRSEDCVFLFRGNPVNGPSLK